jgi:uncharacterized cupin superfamily protein
MTTIFKSTDRQFTPRPQPVDGFNLLTDASITSGMAASASAFSPSSPSGANNMSPRTPNLGAGSLNFDMRQLPPGQISSLYHFHRHAEELFMITAGTATLRTPAGTQILNTGDIAFFPTGPEGAHQLYNHTSEPCEYLDIRTFAGADIAEYPDSDKFMLLPTPTRFPHNAAQPYFHGEPTASQLRSLFNK